jgi:hypothetical protein
MAYGHYEGKEISDPELRKMFDRDVVINSDWYKERLKRKQDNSIATLKKQIGYLEDFAANADNAGLVKEMNIHARIETAKERLVFVESDQFLKDLTGTIGADPLMR